MVLLEKTEAKVAWGRQDLRDWLEIAEQAGKLERLHGAHWDREIGGITEMSCLQAEDPPCLLFDRIPDYPEGYRVATNFITSRVLAAEVLGLPRGLKPGESVQAWREKSRALRLTPTLDVAHGPVLENVQQGQDIDLWQFPTPRWHEQDGGRYLGTGDIVVTQDPEDGHLNVGTYRMMVMDRDKIGLYISPGHGGRGHREKCFARNQPMPVVAAFGQHPLLLLAGSLGLPVGMNEYEWVGGVRGAPVEVIRGEVTGLPMPADAEIVVEGYVYPSEMLDEGPFGEWTGYYASAMRQETFVKVERLYYPDNPIILGSPPMRPPGDIYWARRTISQALIWDALEAAGVPDVRAVTQVSSSGNGLLVIAIKQRYAGHAKQAALIASQSRNAAYMGRYIVVVDEDIDTYNIDEVLWAISTRSDPAEADLVRNCWSTPLDPRIPPEKRARRDFSNNVIIIDATRPFYWRDQFPPVVKVSADFQQELRQKWGDRLFQ